MAENKRQTVMRIPRVRYVSVQVAKTIYRKFGKTETVMVPEIKSETYFDYAIMEHRGFGNGTRQPVAIIEDATYADAVKFMKSDRTESGHSVKGFKKLKPAS